MVKPEETPSEIENVANKDGDQHSTKSEGTSEVISALSDESNTGKNLSFPGVERMQGEPNPRRIGGGGMPRFLEIEISPLLLCGIFSLSSTAKARKEMERGYLKIPRKVESKEYPQVSLSLPILHLQSSGGKRKKIIGWDKAHSPPLRVVIDSESKINPVLEYGVVGQDNKDVTPLGTVELPVRYSHMGPSQLHLNLKKRPLWPTNGAAGKSNNSLMHSTKFRLSANSRLSLQINTKAGNESEAVNMEAKLGDIEEENLIETKPSGKRTLPHTVFASLFRCLNANNEKEAAREQDDNKLKTIQLTAPSSRMVIDPEENSLLAETPDQEPKIIMLLGQQTNIKARTHSRTVKLPMSFSSTTGSRSDTDITEDMAADHFKGFFCYPLLPDDDDSSDEDSTGDENSAVHIADPSKTTRVPRETSELSLPQKATEEPSDTKHSKTKRGPFAALKKSLLAWKFRCVSSSFTQSFESNVGEEIKVSTRSREGRNLRKNSELVEIVSDETNSESTAQSGSR